MRVIDSTDRALLACLKQNARMSVTEMATTLSLSRATVNARIQSLRDDGVIRRFTVELSEAADQDVIHAVSLCELDLSRADRVHSALKRMPEVTDIYSTNGKWSLVLHTETPNLAAFDALLNRLGKLSGVTNVETCLLLSRIK